MTNSNRRAAAMMLALALASMARAAEAQEPVADVLRFLVTNQSVATGSFERDRAAAEATSDTIGQALLAGLATLPVSSSSNAFAYRLNPELGTVERATKSFGPIFSERATTPGHGVGSLGLTFQHLRFTSLDGQNLRDGTLVTTANQFTDEATPFDVDRLTLNIDADVTTLSGRIGLGPRFELGADAPFVALRMTGSRVNTYRGRTFTQASASAEIVGLADVVTRGKYTIYAEEGAGLAASADLRLPTGDTADLVGAGATSLRLMAIGSLERGRFSGHANLSGTVGGIAREVAAAGAVSVAASERLTLVGEVTVRRLDRPGHLVTVTAPHPALAGVNTLRLGSDDTGATFITVAPGLKWNPGATWVLVANVGVPLTNQGLTAPWTPFVGIDWSPGR